MRKICALRVENAKLYLDRGMRLARGKEQGISEYMENQQENG